MSRGGPNRHFTLTLEPELAAQFEHYMTSHGFSSKSLAANTLLAMALAATPEDGAVSADRARAFNEIRHWTITEVNKAFNEIRQRLEFKVSGF